MNSELNHYDKNNNNASQSVIEDIKDSEIIGNGSSPNLKSEFIKSNVKGNLKGESLT